jgi:hypothetical protein
MHSRKLQRERPDARALYAIVGALLIAGLAGCATEQTPTGSSSTEAPPYIGVFTGEFVEGKPLYRFPPMEVVGSRSSVIDHEMNELDRGQHVALLAAATRAKLDRLREDLRGAGR